MSRAFKACLIVFVAQNLLGFISWLMLWERIHSAPQRPLVATQQVVPLAYKGTTRFITPFDDRLLHWSDGTMPLVITIAEFGVLSWLWSRKPRQ